MASTVPAVNCDKRLFFSGHCEPRWIRNPDGVVLRNDTRAKAETLLSVVKLEQFISGAIYELIGPRANMQGNVRFGSLATFLDVRFSLNDVRFTPESGHVRLQHVR